MTEPADFSTTCPLPITDYPQILLAHGGGGTLMHQLIQQMFVPTFDNPLLSDQGDGAVFEVADTRLAFSTDSYVVHPLFFPGGDIGSLAVHGTVNDLAMCGARPQYLSVGLIIEEGLSTESLWRIVQSMQQAAAASGITIVTGDTKVVDHGKGDGLFINTAGVGIVPSSVNVGAKSIRAGDAILVSGDIGRHGIAIMAEREGLAFDTQIRSDSASVVDAVQSLLSSDTEVHCMRDLTRGGLATSLNELATASALVFDLDEGAIPVNEQVRGACELLGLDPMYVACEGRFVVFCPEANIGTALDLLRAGCGTAARIGRVRKGKTPKVTMTSAIGALRIVDMLSGEQLPRIC